METTVERLAALDTAARESGIGMPSATPISALIERVGELRTIADRFCIVDLDPISIGLWTHGADAGDVEIALTFDDDMDVTGDVAGFASAVQDMLGFPVVPHFNDLPARDTVTVRTAGAARWSDTGVL